MADLSMNVNYAKPQTTSLGDMLGMASGIQNFQQAQQLNPLVLQKAQQEVEQDHEGAYHRSGVFGRFEAGTCYRG